MPTETDQAQSSTRLNRLTELADALPSAIGSAFPISKPNRSVRLYRGPMELQCEDGTLTGRGVVELGYFPSPRIIFRLSSSSLPDPNLREGRLFLPSMNQAVDVVLSGISIRDTAVVSGRLKERTSVGEGRAVRRLRFHLLNFHDYVGALVKARSRNQVRTWCGRLVLSSKEWRVTIDSLPNLTEVYRTLRDVGGFAVTHVGQVERIDDESFEGQRARDIIEALFWLFSFARGFCSPPILPTGFDAKNRRAWQEWFAPRATAWRGVDSWFDETQATALVDIFPVFMRCWDDPSWRDPLTSAIHWYVEANTVAGGIEGSIVLTQAALELLAWVLLVERGQVFSATKLDQLSAEGRIDRLLTHVGIPLGLPFRLAKLVGTEMSGPGLLVSIRNALVHAKPAKRAKLEQVPFEVRVGAWTLGLWYLELILLWVLGFQGSYSNRLIEDRWAGQVERVPWVR